MEHQIGVGDESRSITTKKLGQRPLYYLARWLNYLLESWLI